MSPLYIFATTARNTQGQKFNPTEVEKHDVGSNECPRINAVPQVNLVAAEYGSISFRSFSLCKETPTSAMQV